MEQQHVLSTLGTNEEATQVRAKMQSLSLVSDMQSFKVCVFKMETESFVLFYVLLCLLNNVIVTRFAKLALL